MSITMQAIKQFVQKHLRFLHKVSKIFFWFSMGVLLGLFFLVSFGFLLFRLLYHDVIYPGVYIGSMNVGGQTPYKIDQELRQRNNAVGKSIFTFQVNDQIATISARQLGAGYDTKLLAQQAYSIGRSSDVFSNISLIFQGYISNVNLTPAFTYNQDTLKKTLHPLQKNIHVDPIDAIFTFQNNKVTAFKPSSDGKDIDMDAVKNAVQSKIAFLMQAPTPQAFLIKVPTKVLHPKIMTEDANKYGIKELIGTGTSLFLYSIPGRIHNIELAASRVNNILVAPNEILSFDSALGDVSAFTGYQQAYVIQNGKTVLGDGGGVCQVSTTLFRAILNAGLPIVERHAHAYRVEYYEEDGPPGIDATVYFPTVDLKFKNDTGHYLLIQSVIDPEALRLTYSIYGVSDGRKVAMTTPIVTNVIPAPPPLYTDDPTFPSGTIKQTDFAAAGATVTFSRTVTRGNQTLISETYKSVYQPWQAAYLRGTGPAQ